MHIVGIKCYAHVAEQKCRKMDRKAVIGYFVGYDENERYRIYVPDRNDVVVFRVMSCLMKNYEAVVILPLNEDIENGEDKGNTKPTKTLLSTVLSEMSIPSN